ncbi:MAG: hypothetical protein AAF389_09505 [Gemmatimonadota bacterium]
MKAPDARDFLMEGAPEALEKPGAEWTEALEDFPDWPSAALRIVEANRQLDAALSEHPPIDAAEIVRKARVTSASTPPPRSDRPMRRRVWPGAALLAAAAAAILILVSTQPPRPPADEGASVGSVVQQPAPIPVVVSNADAAILPTSNPDITVVWFFSGE